MLSGNVVSPHGASRVSHFLHPTCNLFHSCSYLLLDFLPQLISREHHSSTLLGWSQLQGNQTQHCHLEHFSVTNLRQETCVFCVPVAVLWLSKTWRDFYSTWFPWQPYTTWQPCTTYFFLIVVVPVWFDKKIMTQDKTQRVSCITVQTEQTTQHKRINLRIMTLNYQFVYQVVYRWLL